LVIFLVQLLAQIPTLWIERNIVLIWIVNSRESVLGKAEYRPAMDDTTHPKASKSLKQAISAAEIVKLPLEEDHYVR